MGGRDTFCTGPFCGLSWAGVSGRGGGVHVNSGEWQGIEMGCYRCGTGVVCAIGGTIKEQ